MTSFKDLTDQIQALAPMCNFERPEILCSEKEIFIRARYIWLNKKITSLVNLRT